MIEEILNNSQRTLRQIFGSFKKSNNCFELQSYLLRKQFNMCPTTKEIIYLNKDTHLSHIISLKNLEKLRVINSHLAETLTISESNLFLEKGQSNKKRSSKNCEELLDDLLEQLSLTEEELNCIL